MSLYVCDIKNIYLERFNGPGIGGNRNRIGVFMLCTEEDCQGNFKDNSFCMTNAEKAF